MKALAVDAAQAIGAGHSFVIVLKNAFPINVLNAVKACPEVCRIYCATANPLQVVVAETEQGRGILGVVDGSSPKGVEDERASWRQSCSEDRLQALGPSATSAVRRTLAADPAHEPNRKEADMGLALSSPSFAPGGEIPTLFTCEDSDLSPALDWTGVPEAAKSLVLIVDDPDAPDPKAPKMTWVHWVLYNLPPTARGLPEAVAPSDLPAGTRAGHQRLEAHRLRRALPAHRPAPLLPQALRPRRRAPGPGRGHEAAGRGGPEGARPRPGRAHGDLPEEEVAGSPQRQDQGSAVTRSSIASGTGQRQTT